ncbi:MAG: hypothetical protein HY884_04305 [Deltaproteobacteria bacterium]|nr:hypothetical protein [Deltaproteobacteria bacterium]
MVKRLTIFVIAVLLTAIGAGVVYAAEDWRFFHSSSTDNTMLYYDFESMVSPAKNVINVWIKQEVRGKIYSFALWEVSCGERKIRTLIKHGYDGVNGGIIELPNSDETYPTKFAYIVPETLEAKLAKIVCPRRGGLN